MPAKLSRIHADDPDLNRVQDHLASVLNPVLSRAVLRSSAPPAVTGAKGGNEALASLLAALQAIGLIEDKTT